MLDVGCWLSVGEMDVEKKKREGAVGIYMPHGQ